jgi:hypothetical protein
MYVRDPNGKFEVFSQKEVGGAFAAGSAIMPKAPATTTLNVSSLFSKPAPIRIDGTQGTGRPSNTSASQTLDMTGKGWMFAPKTILEDTGPKSPPTEVDCSVPGSCLPSTGAMVGIAVGAVVLIGGVAYLAMRKKLCRTTDSGS